MVVMILVVEDASDSGDGSSGDTVSGCCGWQ